MDLKYLRKLLSYDEFTGEFVWLKSRGRVQKGQTAGNVSHKGYCRIRIDGREYSAHRLAWYITYGVFPKSVIDHIDGDPLNNSLKNLRECTQGQNIINSRKRAAHKGVRRTPKGRFQARITLYRVEHYLGTYDTAADAAAAYRAAAILLHGEFACFER